MNADESKLPDENQVRDVWDSLISEDQRDFDPDEGEVAEAIHFLHSLDFAPDLDETLQRTIWEQVKANLPAEFAPASTFSSNGHVAGHVLSPDITADPESPSRGRIALKRAARVYRALAVGAMSGAIAGAFAGGIGARVAMRIAGSLSDGPERYARTQDGNIVGQLSIGGSIALILFAALIGMSGGILYMPVRSMLRNLGRTKGLVYGTGLLFTLGFVIMDKGNPDYRTFGSPALNVGAFSACYVLFGVVVAPVADWIDRKLPAWPLTVGVRLRHAVGHALIIFFGGLGLLVTVATGLVGGGLIVGALGLAIACGIAARIYESMLKGKSLSWRHPSPLVRQALIGGPALAGVVVTLRSVASILGIG